MVAQEKSPVPPRRSRSMSPSLSPERSKEKYEKLWKETKVAPKDVALETPLNSQLENAKERYQAYLAATNVHKEHIKKATNRR